MIARRLVATHPTLKFIVSLVLGALLLLIATMLLLLLLLLKMIVLEMLLLMVSWNRLNKLGRHLMGVGVRVQVAVLNA